MAKPKGLRDIIGDAIEGKRPKKINKPYKFRDDEDKRPPRSRPRPRLDREKYQMPKRRPNTPRGRAQFPEPMVEGQKRYPAYNVQPKKPKGKRKRRG